MIFLHHFAIIYTSRMSDDAIHTTTISGMILLIADRIWTSWIARRRDREQGEVQPQPVYINGGVANGNGTRALEVKMDSMLNEQRTSNKYLEELVINSRVEKELRAQAQKSAT